MSLSKEESGARVRVLRDLIVHWDPLGLIGLGSPNDEYDCLVGPLLGHLESGVPRTDIVAWLQGEFSEHFGCKGARTDAECAAFVQLVQAWAAQAGPSR